MIVFLAICVCNNMITGITRYVRDVFMVCKLVTQSRALFTKLAYTLKQESVVLFRYSLLRLQSGTLGSLYFAIIVEKARMS